MSFDSPRGIIELGNINFKCLIFKINNDNDFEILSTSVIQSEGIHNGVVVNLVKASKAIRSCISKAENKIKFSLKKINVVIEQPDFLCTKFSKDRKINGSKIYKEDIEFLLKEAKKQVILNDNKQSIIHIFNHNYIVDGKTFIEEPIGIFADYLSHEMTFVTMPKNNINNINQVFFDCDIEVERIISCTFSLATQLLNINELKFGATLINIGSEKISLGLFKNLALIHSITFPVGVSHITKDISKVCLFNMEESQLIRNKIDYSFKNNEEIFDENDYLREFYFKNSSFRKISKSLIINIVKARLDEIFHIIKKQIIETGLNSTCGRNLYITGGGSNLFNLDKYCSNFFGLIVKNLEKNDVKESKVEVDESFSACLGALKIIKDGWETEAIPKLADKFSKKTGIFNKIFGKGL
jgi:cell division protein FtsA